ncbi:MAG TPA: HAD hydrolase-like protein [Candidatus Olsenella pullicola]|nr:HAD hydrolase-like protein [Candidatus Olsenella pullicola]
MDVTTRDVVLFDFDGTLANTVPAIARTARRVLLAHGLTDETIGDIMRLIGPPFPQAYSLVYGFSPEEAAQITAEYRAIYTRLGVEGWPLFAGMRELLEDLRAAGRHLGVASSKRTTLVRQALADNDALDLFDVVCAKPSDDEISKSQIIDIALSELGASCERSVMVGDRHNDVEAAAQSGIPCVGVSYGGATKPGELEGAGAFAVAASVDELRRVLLG